MEFPYFPLYVSRFLSGTMEMDGAEVGGYLLLLLRQWDKNGLPDDDKELAKIARVKPSILKSIKSKFEKCDDGLLRNRVLEEVREEVRKKYEKNKKNGEKGGRPAKEKKQEEPKANPKQTQNKPVGFDWETQTEPSGGEIETKSKIETNTSVLEAPTLSDDRPDHAPTWQAVLEVFYRMGKPDEAKNFFLHYESFNWEMRGTKIMQIAPLVNKWLTNPISMKAAAEKGQGRKVIMGFNGGEVDWSEEKYQQYRNNPAASGYSFLRYEN